MYFKDIKYLGGLPYPFNQVGSVDILLNDTVRQLVIKQGSKIYTLPIQNIYKVHVESDHDRSPSKGIVGYIIGSMIGKKSGLLGAAYGARKKDISKLIIVYRSNNRQLSIVLQPEEKAWKLYSAINAFII